MAWPGTIQFTRERTIHVKQQGEKEKEDKEEKDTDEEKPCQEKVREIKIKVVATPSGETKIENPQVADIWPRRKRTDITELYH